MTMAISTPDLALQNIKSPTDLTTYLDNFVDPQERYDRLLRLGELWKKSEQWHEEIAELLVDYANRDLTWEKAGIPQKQHEAEFRLVFKSAQRCQSEQDRGKKAFDRVVERWGEGPFEGALLDMETSTYAMRQLLLVASKEPDPQKVAPWINEIALQRIRRGPERGRVLEKKVIANDFAKLAHNLDRHRVPPPLDDDELIGLSMTVDPISGFIMPSAWDSARYKIEDATDKEDSIEYIIQTPQDVQSPTKTCPKALTEETKEGETELIARQGKKKCTITHRAPVTTEKPGRRKEDKSGKELDPNVEGREDESCARNTLVRKGEMETPEVQTPPKTTISERDLPAALRHAEDVGSTTPQFRDDLSLYRFKHQTPARWKHQFPLLSEEFRQQWEKAGILKTDIITWWTTRKENGISLLDIFREEQAMYKWHACLSGDISGERWHQIVYYSLSQQLFRQDPLAYRVCVELRDDHNDWLLSYPPYAKLQSPGNDGFQGAKAQVTPSLATSLLQLCKVVIRSPESVRSARNKSLSSLQVFLVGIQDDHHQLDLIESVSWDHISVAHRDFTMPLCTFDDQERLQHTMTHAFPAALQVHGLGMLSDALVGRIRWDNPLVLHEQAAWVLHPDMKVFGKGYDMFQERSDKIVRELFQRLKQLEKEIFGKHSYFLNKDQFELK